MKYGRQRLHAPSAVLGGMIERNFHAHLRPPPIPLYRAGRNLEDSPGKRGSSRIGECRIKLLASR